VVSFISLLAVVTFLPRIDVPLSNLFITFKDPTKENPYEDIPVQPLPMWRTPSAWKLLPPKSAFRTPKVLPES
jgi:hypothetical protein